VKKIALIGSAPSSVQLAPYDDPSWVIWGCSPGAWPHVKRADRWFEVHKREIGAPWFSTEYIQFMATKIQGPVFVAEPWPEVPNHIVLDHRAAMDFVYGYTRDEDGNERPLTLGPYLWASSLSHMMAMAISERPDEIALYGVDMSAKEEWHDQRLSCQQLIWIAKGMGIKVTVPPESDLVRPHPAYGFREIDPMHIKLLSRKGELTQRIQNIDAQLQAMSNERMYLIGALDDLEYMLNTWVPDKRQVELAYAQPPERHVPAYVSNGKLHAHETSVAEYLPPVKPRQNGKENRKVHAEAEA
jgi:hypothetical protein